MPTLKEHKQEHAKYIATRQKERWQHLVQVEYGISVPRDESESKADRDLANTLVKVLVE
jgi:hypothetical protein